MNTKELMMALGICAAGILTLWFISSILKGDDPLIEGLDNKNSDSSSKAEGSKLSSTLNKVKLELDLHEDVAGISKYRSKWEDLIVDMEKVAQLGVLETLIKLGNFAGNEKQKQALIEQCNNYSKLATSTLPAAMTFVDNYSASSAADDSDD